MADELAPKKLYRSRDDVMVAGVCGGLAEYLKMDATVVRILFVGLHFVGVPAFLLYVILLLIVPYPPEG